MDMYMEEILDHYKNPRNSASLENPDIRFSDSNPLCGDQTEVTIKLNAKNLNDLRFCSKGCAISVASASMLSERLIGKDIEFVKNLKNQYALDMLGITLTPIRVKCALLPLVALKKALNGGKIDSPEEALNRLRSMQDINLD